MDLFVFITKPSNIHDQTLHRHRNFLIRTHFADAEYETESVSLKIGLDLLFTTECQWILLHHIQARMHAFRSKLFAFGTDDTSVDQSIELQEVVRFQNWNFTTDVRFVTNER